MTVELGRRDHKIAEAGAGLRMLRAMADTATPVAVEKLAAKPNWAIGAIHARSAAFRATRHPSGVPRAVPYPARYDDTVSAQPAEREDPLDPQRILDQLPADERGFFLDQYREAVDTARDPAGWKQLRRVLRLWRFHADAAGDPGYREALDAARGPVSGGMPLEDAVRMYRPAR
jgi:hypothetical protein